MARVDVLSAAAGLVLVVLGLVAAGGGLGPLVDRPARALPVLAAVVAVALAASVLRRRSDDPAT